MGILSGEPSRDSSRERAEESDLRVFLCLTLTAHLDGSGRAQQMRFLVAVL